MADVGAKYNAGCFAHRKYVACQKAVKSGKKEGPEGYGKYNARAKFEC